MRDRATARAVLAMAGPRGVVLLSPPDAAYAMGAAWFLAVVAGAEDRAMLDCGDAGGHALAALRLGCRAVVLDPGAGTFAAVAAAAAEIGAVVLPVAPPAFDPGRQGLRQAATRARLAAWLAA